MGENVDTQDIAGIRITNGELWASYSSVVANLVRYGVRDHCLGAVFLSVLGLLVVGFMVLLSAKRQEVCSATSACARSSTSGRRSFGGP